MLILALETATRAGSAALQDDARLSEVSGDPSRSHSQRLPAELVEWLRTAGWTFEDVDLFAVVTGPGSFTGLRVGLAAVQGLALALGRRVVGVPTADAWLEAWLTAHPRATGTVAVCLDGARGDVFFAAWDVTGAARAEDARVVVPLQVGSPETFAQIVRAAPGTQTVVVIGDAERRYHERIARELPGADFGGPAITVAAGAARIAARRQSEATAPHALKPIYVRRPDAVIARERANAAPDDPGFSIEETSATGDVAHAAALQAKSFAHAWGADAIQWELANLDAARLFVLKTAEGRVVAYCACWQIADELHVNSLAVDPGLRRRGLGRRLMTAVQHAAVARGARAATLEVRESNVAARRLYEGLGFRVEGVRRGYYQDPREDALVLWRRDLAER